MGRGFVDQVRGAAAEPRAEPDRRRLWPGYVAARAALGTHDRPDRSALLGVPLGQARNPSPGLPQICRPDLQRSLFAKDDALAGLLRSAGFEGVQVQTVIVRHRLPVDDFWNAILGATVRTAALIEAQPPDVRALIREEFDRRARTYAVPGATEEAIEIPISAKLASGRKPE